MAWNNRPSRWNTTPAKKVVWKTNEGGVIEKPEPLPFMPSFAEQVLTLGTAQFWQEHRVPVGAMFVAVQPLQILMPAGWAGQRKDPPLPYLHTGDEKYNPKGVVVSAGSILTYLGEIRVEEGVSKAQVRRVLRRKFLVGAQIYVVFDLDAIRCVPCAKFNPDME
jgi:hypothetical protein